MTKAKTKTKKRAVLCTWKDAGAQGGTSARTDLTEAGIKVCQRMNRSGHPLAAIAATLGISLAAFNSARKRQPKLEEALAIGLGELEHELVNILLESARKGNFIPAIFLLKTKCKFVEQKTAEPQEVNVRIQIPPPMSDAEFQKLITPPVIDVEFEEVSKPRKVVR